MSDLDTLRHVLDDLEWEPEQDETVSGFHIDFGPPHFPVATAFAAVADETKEFVFYINFGVNVAPADRETLMHSITRVNWGLTIGNFELNLDDGHLRFKSSVAYGGAGLSESLICNVIERAMSAVEAYGAELMGAIGAWSEEDGIVADNNAG
jgi:hypothetical protein